MSKVIIRGSYNTSVGSFIKRDPESSAIIDSKSIYDLINEAGKGAIQNAKIDASEIDAIWLGASLLANQEHVAPLALNISPEKLTYIPMTRTEGDMPINLSGGLKSKGHPVGATGASMYVFLYKQIMGEPIGLASIKEPEIAGLINVGDSGVTNCSTILRRMN